MATAGTQGLKDTAKTFGEGVTTAFIIALVVSSIARLVKQETLYKKKESKEDSEE